MGHFVWWRRSKLARVPFANRANDYRFCGCIDLLADEVVVEAVDGSQTAFKLQPMRGAWEASCFQEGVRGSMVLDAEGSQHTREKWIEALLAQTGLRKT